MQSILSSDRKRGVARWLTAALIVAVALPGAFVAVPPAGAAATLLSVNFNSGTDGFAYADDAFGTSQPSYADGTRTTSGGYGSSGGLQVTLGGVNGTSVTNGMSGAWSITLNAATAQTGVSLSFRYKLSQTATYEYDEYSRVRVKVDGVEIGRGVKSYVDHIGGDGSSTLGNSDTFLPTTDWQLVDLFLGDWAAGNHTLTLGGFNNKKDASDESTTLVIDDVTVTSGNPAPSTPVGVTLASRVDYTQYLSDLQKLATYHDRCRGSGMSCSSTDYSTNFMNALSWVESQLQALGYTTVRHNFNYNGNTGTNLWATKMGTVTPTQMYMVSGHLDGRGGGDAFDDDGSGAMLALQVARVLAGSDVTTDKSVRFIFWDKEELGLYGAYGYVQDRRSLQGTTDEPTWLGLIQHDMILYDHGAGSVTAAQSPYADLDVEWRAGTTKEADSSALALKWRFANGLYAPDYPATAYNYSTNTDDTPFQPYVASVSVRENRRSLTSGTNAEWINPYYHQTTDVENSYKRDDDGDGKRDDIELGVNAVRTTLGLVAELAGAHLLVANQPPTANAQSVTTPEDTATGITLTGSDPESQPLTYQVLTNPAHGNLSGVAPNLTYTPAANYNGPDSFTFKARDASLDSAAATVSITITPVNDPPSADPQSVSTALNTPTAITLTGSDIDGDPLSYRVTVGPSRGALSGAAPNLTYTPPADYIGSDSFAFVANDGAIDSSPATVTIAIEPPTLNLPFADDFETYQGWAANPQGTDGADTGLWERGQAETTDSGGPKQLTPASGQYDLVTGAAAGGYAAVNDIDDGLTSVRSPGLILPAGQPITLRFKYAFAHSANSSADDFLRVKVVGTTTSTLLDVHSGPFNLDGGWTTYAADLSPYAGQTVYLLVEAADGGTPSIVEAGLDDVSVAVGAPGASVLSASFDGGTDGFTYADDAFRATGQPDYAEGGYLPAGGAASGGLQVTLGGMDAEIVLEMSGGWSGAFTLDQASPVNVSFRYKLTQASDYEDDELSQALVSVDGVLLGQGGQDYLIQMAGNGNGGAAETTNWVYVSLDTGALAAGAHVLTLGGYNNRKSWTNETTEIVIDDVKVRIP